MRIVSEDVERDPEMAQSICFRLNGEMVAVDGVAPSTTVLNWLRYDRCLTGSKEGCAEGDCGACTIAVRRGTQPWRPVCACIMLMPMLHGLDVRTIESLAARDGTLHPVQQALSDGHGSQCGFCTPGIVMALWADQMAGGSPDAEGTIAALSGNLCRCTGYGPIIDAARVARDMPAPADLTENTPPRDPGPLSYAAAGRSWLSPDTEDALAKAIFENPSATILSGATDIGLWVTKKAYDPVRVIYTGRVSGMEAVEERDGWLEIGATAPYADASAALSGHWPAIGALIRRIGGAQVRAMGTIGGNIANGSPIGDMAPALMTIGTQLVLRRGGAVREIDLADFFVAYGEQDLRSGEYVSKIRVPLPEQPSSLACYKLSKRFDQDISSVLGCFEIHAAHGVVRSVRIAFGGMAGIPARARATEAALLRRPWTPETIGDAMTALAEDFQPIDDMRASSEYRMQAAQNLLLRYYYEQTASGFPLRIEEVTA